MVILIACTDLTELVGLCDRVLVFHRDRITDGIDRTVLPNRR